MNISFQLSSVQFSHSVMSNSLWPHGLKYARLPCPSPIPGAYLSSLPLSWWCHPTVSSSVCPLLLLPSIFPSIRVSFPMSQLLALGGQNIGALASASVLPMNIQGWFPFWLTGLIFLSSMGVSRVFPAPQFESINALALSLLYGPTLNSIHD